MTTDELNALEAAYAKATPEWQCDRDGNGKSALVTGDDAKCAAALHNAFPAMAAELREALARSEGATAYQALCSRLWHEGYAVDLAYQGHYTAKIVCGLTRLVFESQGRHETEVAAVEAAVAERGRQQGTTP